MTKQEVKQMCQQKKVELMEKYFGNIVNEAVHAKPEKVDESRYSLELPRRIEGEYREFLENLLNNIYPEGHKSLDEILNKRQRSADMTEDDRLQLDAAYMEAKKITLLEKITKSNHEDVTYYKGLLKAYTEELLEWMEVDFVEDVCR